LASAAPVELLYSLAWQAVQPEAASAAPTAAVAAAAFALAPGASVEGAAATAMAVAQASQGGSAPAALALRGAASTPRLEAQAGLLRAVVQEGAVICGVLVGGRSAALESLTLQPGGDPMGDVYGAACDGGAAMAARLVHAAVEDPKGDFALVPSPRGAFSNLAARPLDAAALTAALPPGSVVMAVRAVGLNFRDVLNVLGMYPATPAPPAATAPAWWWPRAAAPARCRSARASSAWRPAAWARWWRAPPPRWWRCRRS
jgi:hypothetical protein